MRNIVWILILLLMCQITFAKDIYKDPSQPLKIRVDDLMKRMTLEEKVAQMCQYVGPNHIRETQRKMMNGKIDNSNDANGIYNNLSVDNLLMLTEKGMVGSFLHVLSAKEANDLQRLAQKSKLKIPLLIGIDAIHGNAMVYGTTVYPTLITQASSFDVDLAYRISRETAAEMRATGSHWAFTPNVDIARDARWGRVGETFGEDPFLVSEMGVATIKGLQGDNGVESDKILACVKHLIAGSEPVNGLNVAPMDVSERTIREIYLPPYIRAIKDGHVATMMVAHNEINGTPCHENRWLMTDVIKKECLFDGFFVSDWNDVDRMFYEYKTASSLDEAFKKAVIGGIDMRMHGPDFIESIVKMVRAGEIPIERINYACSKILEAKFLLGLFENPFVDESKASKILFADAHKKNALKMAEEGIVLLKNENLLPLDLSKYKKIFVTGPNSDSQAILGDWAMIQPKENVVTVLDGIREMSGKENVQYYNYGNVKQNDFRKINAAAEMAKSSDVAVVVVGENSLRYIDDATCGENRDRLDIDLLGLQNELIEKICETGIPTIVVLITGRPLAINRIVDKPAAIIQAWEPGSFGGKAIANIICGKVNPSGKLPITIPYSVGQIQTIYNHKPTQYFHKYIDGPIEPLFSFGYGLSYTSYKYGNIILSKEKMKSGETITAEIDVTNVGKMDGVEIVQMYIRDDYSSFTRPVKELKGFKRVALRAGETKRIKFEISEELLCYPDKNYKMKVEPGYFTIMLGPSSLDKDLRSEKLQFVIQ